MMSGTDRCSLAVDPPATLPQAVRPVSRAPLSRVVLGLRNANHPRAVGVM